MLGLTRAPRSFALSPATAPKPAGAPRIELFARLGAVAAALVLTVVTVVPSMTGGAATSLRSASEVAATSSRQAADSAEKRSAEAPATGRAAAPAQAPEGGAGAGGALTAPAAAPAAPAPQAFGTAANSAAPSDASVATPSGATSGNEPLRPVELTRSGSAGVLWYAQVGLAALTVALGLLAAVLFVRRQLPR